MRFAIRVLVVVTIVWVAVMAHMVWTLATLNY